MNKLEVLEALQRRKQQTAQLLDAHRQNQTELLEQHQRNVQTMLGGRRKQRTELLERRNRNREMLLDRRDENRRDLLRRKRKGRLETYSPLFVEQTVGTVFTAELQQPMIDARGITQPSEPRQNYSATPTKTIFDAGTHAGSETPSGKGSGQD